MSAEELAIINRVIEEHHAIRGNIRLVGESVNDLESVFNLQRSYASWSQSSVEALAEKMEKLQQTLSFVDEGLKNHFAFEGRSLVPLLGKIVGRGLLLEHRDIRKEVDKAKGLVIGPGVEGLSDEERLKKRKQVQQAISDVSQMIHEHAAKEEVILKMMKRAVEEEG